MANTFGTVWEDLLQIHNDSWKKLERLAFCDFLQTSSLSQPTSSQVPQQCTVNVGRKTVPDQSTSCLGTSTHKEWYNCSCAYMQRICPAFDGHPCAGTSGNLRGFQNSRAPCGFEGLYIGA